MIGVQGDKCQVVRYGCSRNYSIRHRKNDALVPAFADQITSSIGDITVHGYGDKTREKFLGCIPFVRRHISTYFEARDSGNGQATQAAQTADKLDHTSSSAKMSYHQA